ncbi:hypothetical protein [Rhodoferax sp.]|uniref:hypothetical protein n=1 Tax=Rhodoferax sp. TaxID=50421 RepID=UPI0028508AFA|nr:hypothetical protein [Rhodoferax sp.]MDR3371602.1 hypothetical protein [Rhodoferax sp.]
MTVITVLTRTLFFISGKPWQLSRWAQRQAVLGTIVEGMAIYLPLHLGLGW